MSGSAGCGRATVQDAAGTAQGAQRLSWLPGDTPASRCKPLRALFSGGCRHRRPDALGAYGAHNPRRPRGCPGTHLLLALPLALDHGLGSAAPRGASQASSSAARLVGRKLHTPFAMTYM